MTVTVCQVFKILNLALIKITMIQQLSKSNQKSVPLASPGRYPVPIRHEIFTAKNEKSSTFHLKRTFKSSFVYFKAKAMKKKIYKQKWHE